jgi:hypothetical protein
MADDEAVVQVMISSFGAVAQVDELTRMEAGLRSTLNEFIDTVATRGRLATAPVLTAAQDAIGNFTDRAVRLHEEAADMRGGADRVLTSPELGGWLARARALRGEITRAHIAFRRGDAPSRVVTIVVVTTIVVTLTAGLVWVIRRAARR